MTQRSVPRESRFFRKVFCRRDKFPAPAVHLHVLGSGVSRLRFSCATEGTPTMLTSALGPFQPLFGGLQKQCSLLLVPHINREFPLPPALPCRCLPSSWDATSLPDKSCCRCGAGSAQGSQGSAQKQSPRVSLQALSASHRDTKTH